jgi:hypothetical protein
MNSEPGPWPEEENNAGQAFAAAFESHFAGVAAEPPDLDALGRVAEAQATHEVELLGLPNVVGVAPSIKVTQGQPTGTTSLTVLVESKKTKRALGAAAVVPDTVSDVPTDVVEVGVIRALTFNAKVRPALPGYSIGHHDITAGTFGCLVRDLRVCCECGCTSGHCHCGGHGHDHGHCGGHDKDRDYLILSNNHVLAASNAASPGDAILQPGAFDGGLFPSDEVARLDRFERITFGAAGYNVVDCAVARPTTSRNVTASIIGIAMPRGISQALVGLSVIKVGRTTQVTRGRVLSTNGTIAVNYGAPGVAIYRHQIITTAMSAGGDSGSLLMDEDLNAIGLLYAGSAVITIHNHIADVETALGVRPVTATRSA